MLFSGSAHWECIWLGMHIENVHSATVAREAGWWQCRLLGIYAIRTPIHSHAHPQSIMQYEKPRLVRGITKNRKAFAAISQFEAKAKAAGMRRQGPEAVKGVGWGQDIGNGAGAGAGARAGAGPPGYVDVCIAPCKLELRQPHLIFSILYYWQRGDCWLPTAAFHWIFLGQDEGVERPPSRSHGVQTGTERVRSLCQRLANSLHQQQCRVVSQLATRSSKLETRHSADLNICSTFQQQFCYAIFALSPVPPPAVLS